MPLLAYNITGSPITLAEAQPPVVLPASTNPPERGKAYDVTAELWPNVAVDPGNGRSGGLDAADFTALSAYVGVEYLWTHGPEYLTGALAPAGPPPAPHTHTAASTTAVNSAASTGITDTGAGSSHTHSVASATPAITADKLKQQQQLIPETPGDNYVAQYAGGAAIDDAIGPFTRYVPSRTVQIVLGAGGVATNYTIDGLDAAGAALQEVIPATGAGTFQGARAFASITRVRSDVDPVGTTDVEVGDGFGLGLVASDIDLVGVDGVEETPVNQHAGTGTVVPTTVPNGVHLYTVQYRVLPTATQTAHDHGAATGAEAAHTHGITDPTHNHTQTGHGHSVA